MLYTHMTWEDPDTPMAYRFTRVGHGSLNNGSQFSILGGLLSYIEREMYKLWTYIVRYFKTIKVIPIFTVN